MTTARDGVEAVGAGLVAAAAERARARAVDVGWLEGVVIVP